MSAIPIDIDVSDEFRRLHAKISDFVRTTLDPISLQMEKDERIPEETVEAIQLLGGYGDIQDCEVERFFRDAKTIDLLDGTHVTLRNAIADDLVKRGPW